MEAIADGIYVETAYEGVNVGAVVTDDGIICIDAPSYPRYARHWLTQLDRLHRGRVKFLILTDSHGDRILNTRWLNAPIITHQFVAERLNNYSKRYPQTLIDSLTLRNDLDGHELVSSPVDQASISFSNELSYVDGDCRIILKHMPGPTPGNIWVHVPEKGVLFAGDTVVSGTHPPTSEMNSTEWLISLNILAEWRQPTVVITPGRGQLEGTNSIDPLASYLLKMQSLVQRHINAGKEHDDIGILVDELIPIFPQGLLPEDWLISEVKAGLDRVYVELAPTSTVDEFSMNSLMQPESQSIDGR